MPIRRGILPVPTQSLDSVHSMSFARGTFPFLALFACAAGATAEPRSAARPTVVSDTPLIHDPLKDDADVARAIREYYTKYEYRVPMRDGVALHTVAYVPKDASRTYPILMTRTPYGVQPYGSENFPSLQNGRGLRRFAPSPLFIRQGYIFVHQDVRGKMMSEGTFVDVKPVITDAPGHPAKATDEASDAFDTIDYLIKNVPRHNGRVGVWGISYPGFYAAQAAVNAHPALKAVSPQAPVTDWFDGDDFHHNGAFFLADSFDFTANFGRPRPEPVTKVGPSLEHDAADVYDFYMRFGAAAAGGAKYIQGENVFWNDLMNHGTRDAFWTARDPRIHYKNVRPAMLTVGGVFDAEDAFGALATYRAFETQSPGAENSLVLGPWRHGGWSRTDGDRHGDISFGQKTSVYYRESIEFPFFERHLRGVATPKTAEASVFETGTNQWNFYPAWPPKETQRQSLYLGADWNLSADKSRAAGSGTAVFDSYISDPQKPVPYRSRLSAQIDADYMSDDQRFASRRPDVLTYSSKALDADVALGGPIDVDLWVTTTGTDADFVVKLIDVYPENTDDPEPNPAGIKLGGYQQLVRAEVIRGKFREGLATPKPFVPNTETRVQMRMPDVAHCFRSGHRLMVQVQSTWFPLVDRNPQTFVDIYHAKMADYVPATHRIIRSADHASSLLLPVLRGVLPR